jgi:N-dimethylarginine dimethylaminohydrolase
MQPPKTPSGLNQQVFLLNFPLTVDSRYVNNILMENYRGQPYNYTLAFKQFMGLYNYLAKDYLVYLLPSYGNFQDQVFVANLGCYLPHMQRDTILLSNYTSEPRQGEEEIGLEFFDLMGYDVIQPTMKFEGEADLKWLRDNIYVGGYGIRTEGTLHNWLSDLTGAEIVSIEMSDQGLYHFDCMFLPLTQEKGLVATKAIKQRDLKKIEGIIEVIDVPEASLYDAWTNCLVLKNKVLMSPANSQIGSAFADFIAKQSFEPVLIDLSEFEKSGAALSCCVFHLNYKEKYIGNKHT